MPGIGWHRFKNTIYGIGDRLMKRKKNIHANCYKCFFIFIRRKKKAYIFICSKSNGDNWTYIFDNSYNNNNKKTRKKTISPVSKMNLVPLLVWAFFFFFLFFQKPKRDSKELLLHSSYSLYIYIYISIRNEHRTWNEYFIVFNAHGYLSLIYVMNL